LYKKILITGATGFIGKHVIDEFLKKQNEYEIHVITSNIINPNFNKNIIIHQLDLLDHTAVNNFFQQHKFYGLLHLAWYVGKKCQTANINMLWLQASLNLLHNFAETGGTTFLGAGSVSEYDYSFGYLSEDLTPLDSNTLYGQTKASLYKVANIFCKQNNINFKWVRIFNTYGAYEKPARLIPAVINAMLKNEVVKVSHCQQIQDYLHVQDVACAIKQIFESDLFGAVNICSNIPIQLRDIVEKIAKFTNFKGEIAWGAIEASFDNNLVVGSNQKLKSLGWKQHINLDEGLKQTINWWKNKQNVQQYI